MSTHNAQRFSWSKYGRRWEDFRRRRRVTLACWLGAPAVTFLGACASGRAYFYGLGIGMAAFLLSTVWLVCFRCPRCGKPFIATWLERNPFTGRCVHCELPVDADDATVESPAPWGT